MSFFTFIPSPLGTLTACSCGEAITGLYLPAQKPDLKGHPADDLPVFGLLRHWLEDYFCGLAPDPGTIPMAPQGTDFQKKVWQLLLTIPYGCHTSYGAIAKQISPGMSAQAVGGAVGRNPISILIPCHRVLGADGSLTGYAGGLESKRFLLELERII